VNPWHLTASELLVWGIVLHLIADWPLQNDWMAQHKMKAGYPGDHLAWVWTPRTRWFFRHPAAYLHAGIHCIFLALIFGWVAIPLAIVHLIIDCRWPIVWWSTKVIKQTQPGKEYALAGQDPFREEGDDREYSRVLVDSIQLYDIGTEVRIWTDQVFHIACIAIAALLVTL